MGGSVVTVTASETDFPGPDEVVGFWSWDKMHAPRPISPLAGDLVVPTLGAGFTEAQGEFAAPLAMQAKLVNYYMYASFYPVDLGDETEEDRWTRYIESLKRMVPKVGDLWENEWKPSILPTLTKGKTADYTTLNDDEILATLDEQVAGIHYRWMIHGRINFILIATSDFVDYYAELFSPEDPTEAYQLLQGFHTRSVDASVGLWKLSRLVRESPVVLQVFEQLEPKAIVHALEGSAEGKAFLAELRSYLDEYGWRSDAVYDIGDITWREEPSAPLGALQGYIALGDHANPELLFQKAVTRREELMKTARARLADEPKNLQKFNALYEAAKYNLPVTEDHAFYIDQVGIAIFRRFVLELGRRLADRGVIESQDDVFMLHKEELVDAIRSGGDRQATAAQRKAEMAAWAKVVPPTVLGVPPPPGPHPFVAALLVKLLGLADPVEPNRDPDVINGVGASPGTVQGPARVVRSLAEASKLQPGDIMVCEMTLPPWVPLFSTVSAVVADTGGVLSHCAIVAREMGLPAVVGTQVGTVLIKDGMIVTVDGAKGIVRIDSRP